MIRTIEELGHIADQAVMGTSLHSELVFSPDALLAMQGSVQRALHRIQNAFGGLYRDRGSSHRSISAAVARIEGGNKVNIAQDIVAEVKPEILPLIDDNRKLSVASGNAIELGVAMLSEGVTELSALNLIKQRNSAYNRGRSVPIIPGSTYSSSRRANPHLFRTGLRRNISP